MLLTTYLLLLLLAVGLTGYAYLADSHYFGIAAGLLLLILGATMISGNQITIETGETRTINTTNASANSPDQTITVTPVREEISSALSQFLQWTTLLGGFVATFAFIRKVNEPLEEQGVHEPHE